VVWLGYKDSNKHPLYNIHGYPKVFGGSLPAMIWAKFMRFAHRDLPVDGFPAPPPSKSVAVPDVVGQNTADAQKTLEAAGFSVTITLTKSSKPQGTVLTETPKGGTTVASGSMITLTASGNPTPSPSGTAQPPSPTPTKTN
jgi:membrane peptidoglycan carboxypeptidase